MITTSMLIKRTLRIPLTPESLPIQDDQTLPAADSLVRRWDAALMTVGFKLSTEALRHFSRQSRPDYVHTLAVETLTAVRELKGDTVQHNSYFIDFPNNVPDTVEFWVKMLREALVAAGSRFPPSSAELMGYLDTGTVDLLRLPGYGTYQHTFEEMIDRHDEFVPSLKDRLTILHLGGTIHEEIDRLFSNLAGTTAPPSPADRELLTLLAQQVSLQHINFEIPGRETRAIINAALLDWVPPTPHNMMFVQINTITDVLRAVDAYSGGDGTLERPALKPARSFRELGVEWARVGGKQLDEESAQAKSRPPTRKGTRLASLRRNQRRLIMKELDLLLASRPQQAADVYRHREAWKRLGEGLHPHEFPEHPHAQHLFAVARGEAKVSSTIGRFEELMASGRVNEAATVLATEEPGTFVRNLDRLLRQPGVREGQITTHFIEVADRVSSRVLLSLIENFVNRQTPGLPRTFPTRTSRIHVQRDTRRPISPIAINTMCEIAREALLPKIIEHLHGGLHAEWFVHENGLRKRVFRPIVLGPGAEDLALPLTNKHTAEGFGVLPRGSSAMLDREVLRFFIYWRESDQRTDYDLSVLTLDENFMPVGQVSWTNLGDTGMRHSGDITSSHGGATEFIDIGLPEVKKKVRYIVPTVYVYSGDDFVQAHTSWFGYMTMDRSQFGQPFEPRAVRMRADMRGRGRMAMPMVFAREGDGWRAKWLHVYARGMTRFGRVEEAAQTSSLLTRATILRNQLTVAEIVQILQRTSQEVHRVDGSERNLTKVVEDIGGRPVIYIGLDAPDSLPEGSTVITGENLIDLLPE